MIGLGNDLAKTFVVGVIFFFICGILLGILAGYGIPWLWHHITIIWN